MRAFLNLIKALNKISVFSFIFVKRKKHRKLFECLICLFVCFSSTSFDLVFSESLPQAELTLIGQIRVPSDDLIPVEGLNVVLLKLVLNAEGKVIPIGPQDMVKTDIMGKFEFLKVNPDYRAAYQLGTRVDGNLYSSKVFFFKAGDKQVEKDIIIPGITTDKNKLEINQVSLVIESGLSSVTVTEVLSIYNSSPDRIDSRNLTLEHALPTGMDNFTMIQSSSSLEIEHRIVDSVLVINHVFPPGNTQIIFHYNIDVWFGSLDFQRELNHSLDKVSVFTPSGHLQIKSEQLVFSGKQQIHNTEFLAWNGKASDSNQLKFKISNVPVDSIEYIGISGIILLLLFLSAIIFYRRRLIMRDRI